MKKLLFVASILFFQQAFALELAKYPLELNSGEGVNVVYLGVVQCDMRTFLFFGFPFFVLYVFIGQ